MSNARENRANGNEKGSKEASKEDREEGYQEVVAALQNRQTQSGDAQSVPLAASGLSSSAHSHTSSAGALALIQPKMERVDVCIAGAGLIGASLALELAAAGRSVTLLSDAEPLSHASIAAAGMLAADDPGNPSALHALSTLSRDLYPVFLRELERIGGHVVEPQTQLTLQSLASHAAASHLPPLSPAECHALLPQLHTGAHHFAALVETSLDPRQLAAAVRAAVEASGIRLRRHDPVHAVRDEASHAIIRSASGELTAESFVDCTGAWTLPQTSSPQIAVRPRKGQLLTVTLPPSLPLAFVVRTESVYIVPRLHGPQAGRAVIGATVEDRGFDTTVDAAAIAALRASAMELLPDLADAPVAETWAGLRPATADGLPVLGRTGAHTFVAKGHYRNGILLAPATARVMAQLIGGEQPSVDLEPFSPTRAASEG